MKNLYRGLLLTIWSVGLSSTSWGQCFSAPTSYSTGVGPQDIAVGDFNRDGKFDLVTANSNGMAGVSVLLGKGDGSFNQATNFMVSDLPRSIVAGDFNGDGNLDLVVASVNSLVNNGSVSLLLGDGIGNLGSPIKLLGNGTFIKVVAGDFNTDGKPDLAIAGLDMPSVSILINTGNGSFSAPINVAAGYTTVMTVGDFNADAKPDIVTVNNQTNTGSVLLGNGIGGFTVMLSVFNVGNNPNGIATGDFNADGKSDLAVANGSAGSIMTLLGNGIGGFNTPAIYETGYFISSLAVGDFNADGKTDLVTTNLSLNTVSTFTGNGDGSFGAKQDYRAGSYPTAVTVGDFNGDGRSDLVVNNVSGPYQVTILLNCTVSSLVIAQPIFDCTTGQLTIQTAAGDGTFIEYRIAGLRDWNSSNVFTVPAYQRTNTTFTLEARQSGQVVSAPFTPVCQSTTPTTPTAPATLTITSFTCNTTNSVLSSVNFVVGYSNGTFAPALPDLFINGVTDAGKLGQPYSLTFDANQYMDAIQDQATRQTYFVWNFRQACANNLNTALSLATPGLTCASGQLLLNTVGGNGTPIEYRVAGLRDWAGSNAFTIPVYQRNNTTFTLQARQSGQVVSLPFMATCPVSARLANAETPGELRVVVYPNPGGEQFSVSVSGAAGQAVRFHLTNLSGQTLVEQRAAVVSDTHIETLKLPASGSGLYLLQVSTNSQSRTVKVLKP